MALCKGNYLFQKDHHLRTDSSVHPSTVLSPVALDILHQQSIGRKGAEAAFRERFSDYYIADLRFGASNAIIVSAKAASSSSSKNVALKITVEFLFFSGTESWERHESSSKFQGK